MNAPRLADYLRHILEAIDRIAGYVDGFDEPHFESNALVQDAVIRNFEIIGEASRRIETGYPDWAHSHPELPLASAYQMRNAIAHGYFSVDLHLVWATITDDLPPLRISIERSLDDLLGRDE